MPAKKRKKILFVEDEIQWIEYIREDLDSQFDVLTATTVSDAFNALESNPDLSLVVLDLMLPSGEEEEIVGRVAGIQLIERIRRDLMPDVPVMVYSAYLGDLREEIGKLGAFSVLSKMDVTPLELSEKIKEAIEQAELQAAQKQEESDVLATIRRVVTEEIERFAPIRERTIHVPGEGHFELIKPLIGYKRDIERRISDLPFHENVFLMMKFRDGNRELGQFIIESIHSHGLRGVRADQDEWNITSNVYNPIAVLYCCKYGIALFDEPEEHQAYSPNVAYELGMMHYQNKDCLILKHSTLPQLPFDLIKDLYVEYDKDLSVRGIVTSWIKQVTDK